ncbi:ferrous iron transport protein B [Desulfurococcaceae archaeon MEX13E-LK6-19]|nr:ferrous iron transport protein B [Desulfurococcaceae archaeon MEX13E-LK6-19]
MDGDKPRYVVALAGTPNVGKSLVFNKLTGGRAWVGNWPGVTVEKKIGRMKIDGIEVEVVDLPGIYSLTAYSVDEVIARNFIVEEKPDVVVCIVSALNLERGLYLVLSLMELGANVIVDLNMIDLALKEGYEVDHRKLSRLLGVPVVPTIATTGYGIEDLKKALREALRKKHTMTNIVDYGKDVEEKIKLLEKVVAEKTPGIAEKYPARWVVLKLLENDPDVVEKVRRQPGGSEVLVYARRARRELEEKIGDLEAYIVERRYSRAVEISRAVIKEKRVVRTSVTDVLDFVLTHRVFGIPFALAIMYLLFRFAFDVSAPLVDLIDIYVNGYLHDFVAGLGFLPSWLASLLADGVIAGVGTVLTFLPVIAFFFLGFAFLEDTGYMARIAYLVDKIFHKFNLPGKTVVPLIIGFGCNVPAVMATRTIEDENDRKAAALIAPLASCSARLPVYLVIAGAVMGASAGFAVLSMYVLSIVLALTVGLVLRKIVFRGVSSGFIMELPPYMAPRLGSILLKTWERTKKFLLKAGTVILFGVIVVWLLSVTGPQGYLGPEALEDPEVVEKSWSGVLGHWLAETVFKPLGWDWRAAVALLFGFIAKEVVVGSLGVLYGVGEENVVDALAEHHVFTPLTAYAYMVFVLVYVPCIATLAAIRGELGAKYVLLALVYEILLAYILALSITVIGHVIGLT